MSLKYLQENIRSILESKEIRKIPKLIQSLQPYDISEVIKNLDHSQQLLLITVIPLDEAVEAIEYLEPELQYQLLHHLDESISTPLLTRISSDVIVDMLLAIHPLQAEDLLKRLPEDYREKINNLMEYPEDTAGSLVTVDYISVREHWTVGRTIEHIRKIGHSAETISYIYVTNIRGELVGVASLREMIFSNEDIILRDIAKRDIIYISAKMEKEDVASVFSKYNFYALPVVEFQNRLIGIITYDDVVDVIQEETTEDFQKLGGSHPLNRNYFKASVFDLFKNRIVWLLILFAGGAYTARILHDYETAIGASPALAVFIPLLTGTGGNIGSQIVSTLVRALSVGEINFKDILRKELLNGVLIGLCLGLAGFIVSVLTVSSNLGTVIALTTLSIVLWTTCVATLLPIILYRLKADPAVVSGPLITTIVDATGLIIYFTIASIMLL